VNEDAVRARFGRTADLVAEREERRRAQLAEDVRLFTGLQGDERALDAGAGTGALAFALSPLVREVVAVDLVPDLLERGRAAAAAFPNVTFVEGDAMALPFGPGSFDVAGSRHTLHHVSRPELAVAELARVTRPGGLILVIDQLAPVDPLAALELNIFERARDPSTSRILADVDLRGLFDSNGLVLVRESLHSEPRDVEPYLDLAGCEGEARERARSLAPHGYTASIGWYLLRKPGV
jgi:ubiquinone/menaquinone biosynthesis C-methylase UbiE